MPHVAALPPVVFSDDVLRHEPSAEIWVGVRTPGTEVPDRARVLLDAVRAAGADVRGATAHDDEMLERVHEPAMVEHLRTVAADWAAGDYERVAGQDRVVPYVFPTAGMLDGLPARRPAATHARAGVWCYDTMTLVGPGTWEAARAAVDVALTAADLVRAGARAAYAVTRPPGHHATRRAFGGSCYLNNAAVAAESLRAGGAARVAVVDIDAHHGNGTQAVFWERPDVFYASLHVDPGAGWFPHFVGFAEETGAGQGVGATLNLPLPPGTGDDLWVEMVDRLVAAVAGWGADAVVVSLGVDAARTDPESPLEVTVDGYHRTGRLVGDLGLPVVAVQEGGYHLPTLGALTVAALGGLV
jgi:acetoin utilization deacetylase AcuC-like enzyme